MDDEPEPIGIEERWEAVRNIEDEMGLPEGFTWEVYQEEDDWGLVIKLYALIESVVSEILALHFEEPIVDSIQDLSLRGRVSQLRLLSDLHEIPTEYTNFLDELSHLRNVVVHNVDNVNFSLRRYIDSFHDQRFQQFVSKVRYFIAENPVGPDGREYSQEEFVRKWPRETILFGLVSWIHTLHLMGETIRLEERVENQEQLREAMAELADRLTGP